MPITPLAVPKKRAKRSPKVAWYVYIVRCADDTLYTGVTTNVERRVVEHNSSTKAAKYTRPRQPVVLAYSERAKDRQAATRREAALKKLSRLEKDDLVTLDKPAK